VATRQLRQLVADRESRIERPGACDVQPVFEIMFARM
jgi:hypothetical protein